MSMRGSKCRTGCAAASCSESFIVAVVPKHHPMLVKAGIKPGDRIPPEVFCAIPQVLMSMDGSRTGTMDPVLAEHGLQRRVALTVPHFQAVALAIAEAGLLGNLPIHFARAVAPGCSTSIFICRPTIRRSPT